MTIERMMVVAAALALGATACSMSVGGLMKTPGGGGSGGGSTGGAVGDTATGDDRHDVIAEVVEVAPTPGRPTIAPLEPTWCSQLSDDKMSTTFASAAGRQMTTVLDGQWWDGSAHALAALCAAPDQPSVQAQAGYLVQYWVNRTGLTPTDLEPFFTFLATPIGEPVVDFTETIRAACAAVPLLGDDATPRDQVFRSALRDSMGCDGQLIWTGGTFTTPDLAPYLHERGAAAPEILRSYAVLQCLPKVDAIEDDQLARYATCSGDARGLSRRKLESQLGGQHELIKLIFRQQHLAATERAQRYQAAVQAQPRTDEAALE